MGAVQTEQSDLPGTMKLFVVLAFVAAVVAEPEADPYLFYSNLGGYTGYPYAHTPYTSSPYGAYSYPYTAYSGLHHLGKREAEPAAEPEADADADAYYGYGLGYGLGYAGHLGYAGPLGYAGHYGYAGYPAYKSLGYKTLGYKAYGYPYHAGYSYYRGKREAEAEPEPWVTYSRNVYSPYTAYTGYPYTAGYSGYPYTYGYPYAYGF